MAVQKRLAAQILKCSPKRITFNTENLDEIKEAITKQDVKDLIKSKIITRKPVKNTSRGKARKLQIQKSKGRRKGPGSRKGKASARLRPKLVWMRKVRVQRKLLSTLKDKGVIDTKFYRELYLKSKGGFFRSKRHMSLFIKETLEKR
tara:strand:+ start:612 stop:1052 length:441 start_codon:yes stop_codon:yes gene_type:complete